MDIEDIGSIDQKIKEINEKLKKFIVDPNAITTYLLGLTGSGKSTLTNYMMGANLSWKKSKGKYQITNDNKQDFPIIGNTLVSCTDIPSVYYAEEMCFVDPAGFLDTKGPTQQTINSYANAKMFKRGGKTKILLIFQQSTLFSARGGSLVDVAVRLRELFPGDFNNLVHSIMIIITKANTQDLSEEQAIQNIKQITSTNKNLPPECLMMMNTILQFNRVALFPIPKYINTQKIENIRQRIKNLKHCTLSYDATISLSPAAKIKLDDMSREVANTINDCAKLIRAQIQNKFLNKFYKTTQEIQPQIGKIRQALSILTLELDSGGKDSFQKFAKFIDLSSEIQQRVKENYEKIQFCRTLHTQIRTNIKLIDSVVNCLKDALGQLQFQLQKISTKEQIDQMNKKHQNALQQRRKQFKQMTQKMQKDAQKREKEAKQNLQRQRKELKDAMDQSNKQYQQSMAIMNKQLEQIKNRPPQVIQKERGWQICSIM